MQQLGSFPPHDRSDVREQQHTVLLHITRVTSPAKPGARLQLTRDGKRQTSTTPLHYDEVSRGPRPAAGALLPSSSLPSQQLYTGLFTSLDLSIPRFSLLYATFYTIGTGNHTVQLREYRAVVVVYGVVSRCERAC